MNRGAAVLAAVVVSLLVLAPAGALSGVFASDVSNGALVVQQAGGPNGDYVDLTSDRLTLDFSAGGGVSNHAVTRVDGVFTVTNDRSHAVPVWVADNTSALTFYDTDTGDVVEGRTHRVSLAPGESLLVGVRVDTRRTDVSELESMDSFTVDTLVHDPTRSPTPTEAGSGGSGTDSGGTGTSTPTPADDGFIGATPTDGTETTPTDSTTPTPTDGTGGTGTTGTDRSPRQKPHSGETPTDLARISPEPPTSSPPGSSAILPTIGVFALFTLGLVLRVRWDG